MSCVRARTADYKLEVDAQQGDGAALPHLLEDNTQTSFGHSFCKLKVTLSNSQVLEVCPLPVCAAITCRSVTSDLSLEGFAYSHKCPAIEHESVRLYLDSGEQPPLESPSVSTRAFE